MGEYEADELQSGESKGMLVDYPTQRVDPGTWSFVVILAEYESVDIGVGDREG